MRCAGGRKKISLEHILQYNNYNNSNNNNNNNKMVNEGFKKIMPTRSHPTTQPPPLRSKMVGP